jgi:thiamine monophosphate synthase
MRLPVLYPILDLSTLARLHPSEDLLPHLLAFARSLAEGGCTLIQYRAKNLNARQSLSHARELRRALPGVTLIMNDRCDLALAAGFDSPPPPSSWVP